MKSLTVSVALFLLTTALTPLTLASTASAQPAPATAPAPKAQKLVDEVIAANPDMLDVLFHVSPTPDTPNTVIAAHIARDVGEVSGDDDLGVMRSGTPLVEVQKDGKRIGVLVQMQDAQHRSIGALGLMYPYQAGDDQKAVLQRSLTIRDQLAAQIPATAALF